MKINVIAKTIPLNKADISKADVYSVNDLDVTSGILFVSLITFFFMKHKSKTKGAIRRKKLYHRALDIQDDVMIYDSHSLTHTHPKRPEIKHLAPKLIGK